MFRRRPAGDVAVVWLSALAFVVALSALGLVRHHQFKSGVDLAIFTQALWLIDHGDWPYITIHLRHLLGDHVSPGIVFFAPFGAFGAEGLIVGQAIVIGAAAPVLHAVSRAVGARGGVAAIAAVGFLVSPAVHGGVMFDFHPESLVPVSLAAAALALLRGWSTWRVVVPLVVACSLKEDVTFTVAAFGVVAAILGHRRLGAGIVVGAGTWFLVAVLAVQPALGDYAASDYVPRFGGARGDTVGEILRYLVTHPVETARHVFSPTDITILLLLLVSTGLACLFGRWWLLLALPSVAVNFLSDYYWQHQFGFHYFLVPAGAIAVAGAVGAARLGRLPQRMRLATVWLVAVAFTTIGVEDVASGWRRATAEAAPDAVQAARRATIARVPDEAVVIASGSLLPHLAERRDIYQLSVLFDDPAGRLDGRESPLSRSHLVVLDPAEADVERLRARLRKSAYTLRAAADGVEIYTPAAVPSPAAAGPEAVRPSGLVRERRSG